MIIIKGGIKFEKNKPIPEKMKKFIDTYGIRMPFNSDKTTFSKKDAPKIRNKSINEVVVNKDIEVDKDAMIREIPKKIAIK